MDFRITVGIKVYDTEMSGLFLGDFCPSRQIAYNYKALMQNLKIKTVSCFR